MRVLGYIMLHYGADYLEYSLYPLCKLCEKVIILYSLYPSHHQKKGMVNTETRFDLQNIASKYRNIEWIDVRASNEGEHRGKIWEHTKGYDVLVNADYGLQVAIQGTPDRRVYSLLEVF
jgi:hypothetical protein